MKKHQITNTILLVRPKNFRLNEQTAVNNYFQQKLQLDSTLTTQKAQEEFDAFADKLRSIGVKVIVAQDIKSNNTPDSIFPNNWVTFHQNGDVALYPMFAENRRRERREDILELVEDHGYEIKHIIDYTAAEEDGVFLEGTGNLILDRQNRKAYCSLSPRANEDLIIEFCEYFEYMPIIFKAYQTVENQRKLIYHTNVMMCLGETFAVIGLHSIDNKKEQKTVVDSLQQDGKEIIALTERQIRHFAGNMLQVRGADEQTYLVMSQAARESLDKEQIKTIENHCSILSSDLHVIETLGGGSARCMMAEVFLPKA